MEFWIHFLLADQLKGNRRGQSSWKKGERGGSVVELWTPEQEVGVQNLPPLCYVLEQDTLLPESTGYTQKAVATSRHD